MLTMETDGTRIVLEEEVVGMDQRIVVAKESNDEAFVVVYAREALLRDIAIGLDKRFVNIELLHAVGTRIEECLLAHHVMLTHGVGNLKGRVYEDAVVAMQLLGKHATHGSA